MPNDQQDLQPLQQLLTLLRPMPTQAAALAANNTPIPPLMNSGAWQRRALDRQVNPQNYPNSVPQPGIGSNIGSFLMRALQSVGDYARQQNQQRQQQFQQLQKTGHLTPGYAASETGAVGPMAGTIAPEATMTPLARAMMQNIEKNYPEFYQKLVKALPTLMPFAQQPEWGTLGTLRMNRPSVEMAQKVGQPQIAEQATHGVMTIAPSEIGTTTPLHEGQHFLNFPRVQQTDPADAATIGMLLNEILPTRGQGSLMQRLNQYQGVAPIGIQGPLRPIAGGPVPLTSMPNLVKALGEPLSAEATQPIFGSQGYYKPGESAQDFLGKAMMDEGLAYLSEQSVKGAMPPRFKYLPTPTGTHGEMTSAPVPLDLQALAQKLGVALK